ncbi:MAG: hypothetical protein L6R35_004668 [Caloplaca aegaea]|nr:MAG: hypothetical protein L6R35_004668 [Caloplaca aegaea]
MVWLGEVHVQTQEFGYSLVHLAQEALPLKSHHLGPEPISPGVVRAAFPAPPFRAVGSHRKSHCWPVLHTLFSVRNDLMKLQPSARPSRVCLVASREKACGKRALRGVWEEKEKAVGRGNGS